MADGSLSALYAAKRAMVRGDLSPAAFCLIAALDELGPASGGTFRLGDRALERAAHVKRERLGTLCAEAVRVLGRDLVAVTRCERGRSRYYVSRSPSGPRERPDRSANASLAPERGQGGAHLAPDRGQIWPPTGARIPSPSGDPSPGAAGRTEPERSATPPAPPDGTPRRPPAASDSPPPAAVAAMGAGGTGAGAGNAGAPGTGAGEPEPPGIAGVGRGQGDRARGGRGRIPAAAAISAGLAGILRHVPEHLREQAAAAYAEGQRGRAEGV